MADSFSDLIDPIFDEVGIFGFRAESTDDATQLYRPPTQDETLFEICA